MAISIANPTKLLKFTYVIYILLDRRKLIDNIR